MTQHKTDGFTLIELTLSMSFIAILLLSIAMLTMQISSIYNKGITIKQVNDIGQLIADDIRRNLSQAIPASVEKVIRDPNTDQLYEGGRLCIANTIYAWNYGKFLGSASPFNVYAGGNTEPLMRLVKFTSDGTKYCQRDTNDILPPIPDNASQFVGIGDRDLAIHAFDYTATMVAGGQTMFAVTFSLGTNGTDVIHDGACQSATGKTDDEYCAVNEFSFVARAGNKGEN